MSARKDLFVYSVCGNAHVSLVNRSLRFLKHFTKCEIAVVAARSAAPIDHDQVISVEPGIAYDNHQASILMKTSLHRVALRQMGDAGWRCCYLDSDVVAVGSEIDSVFSLKSGPVAFAADHGRMRLFSRWAVRCGCQVNECDHLRDAIASKFGVEITEPDWQHWNGGVFLFDSESFDFMDTWHKYTKSIFTDPAWRTRDQGTLAAAVWKHGIQRQPVLPRAFNYIVDAMHGVPDVKRPSLRAADYYVDRGYSLDANAELPRPHFLHFINGSMGARGWKNWDDAEALLEPGHHSRV